MDEKLKSENMQKSSFLCFCYILRAIRAGRCRERRYADHIFIRMHNFVVRFSKFSSPPAASWHWPPNQNPADVFGCIHVFSCVHVDRTAQSLPSRSVQMPASRAWFPLYLPASVSSMHKPPRGFMTPLGSASRECMRPIGGRLDWNGNAISELPLRTR